MSYAFWKRNSKCLRQKPRNSPENFTREGGEKFSSLLEGFKGASISNGVPAGFGRSGGVSYLSGKGQEGSPSRDKTL